jgi:surface polysaccharide O-acyltransferase-like enzyme
MATQLASRPIEKGLPDLSGIPVKKKAPDKEIWLFLVTIAGCLSVIWGHVAADLFDSATNPFQWWVGNITVSIARWCTPVFIMATGYLLLNPAKQYTFMEFYKKRAGRILIPLLFWAFFYAVLTAVRHFSNGVPVTLSSFFIPILTGHPFYHLWYLYMLAGLYLLTPVIRAGMSKIPAKQMTVFCAALFIIPIAVNTYSWLVLKTNYLASYPWIMWCLYFMGYYVAGYLIGKKTRIEVKTYVLVIALLSTMVITAIGCNIFNEKYSVFMSTYFFSTLTPHVVLMNLLVFTLIKKLAAPIKQNKYLETGNTLAFGIYLIHPFWMFLMSWLGLSAAKTNALLFVPVVTISAFVLSVLTAMVILKIPYLRKVI